MKKRFTEAQIAFALRQAESGTSVAEIIRYMGNSYGIVLTVDNRQFVCMVAVSLSAIVSVTMNIVLIPIFDLRGALYASIITHIFLIGICIFFAWQQIHSWLMERRSWLLISIAVATGLFHMFPDQNIVSYAVMAGAFLFIGFIGVSLTEYHNLLRRFYNYASSIFGDKDSAYDNDR